MKCRHGMLLFVLISLLSGQSFAADSATVDYTAHIELADTNYLVSRSQYSTNDIEAVNADFALRYNNNRDFRFLLHPRLRLDALDHHLNRYIPNEAYMAFYGASFETTFGLQTVSWGASHAFNPTQVLNHHDFAYDFFHPENLGDLMVTMHLTRETLGPLKDVAADFYVEPYFQEALLPALDSRFPVRGTQGIVPFTLADNQEKPGYGRQFGGAVSLKGTIAKADLQLIYYHGLDHDPGFVARIDSNGALRIAPFYYTIDMIGFNAELPLFGPLLFHFEGAGKMTGSNPPYPHDILFENNEAVPKSYVQLVPGLDAVFNNIGKGRLTLSAEYLVDTDKGSGGTFRNFRPFENDLFVGVQHDFMDRSLTRLKLGIVKDLQNAELALEASAQSNLCQKITATVGATVVHRAGNIRTPISLFDNNSNIHASLAYTFGK